MVAPSTSAYRSFGDAWTSSWALHGALLALVLATMFLFVDHSGILNSDESVALRQAEVLADTGDWVAPAESPIDPDGEWYPLYGASVGEDGFYSYVKLPLYPLTMAPLLDAGGLGLVLAVHVAAIWATAMLAGRTAERCRSGTGFAAMWLVGAGSPLVFDGYWVMAHAFAALAATGAVWATIRWLQRRDLKMLPLIALLVFVAANYRSEGVLFGIALGLGLVVIDRPRRRRAAMASVVAIASAIVAYEFVARWRAQLLGTEGARRFRPANGDSSTWFMGRLESSRLTLLHPGGELFAVVTIAVTLAIVLAVYLHRRGGDDGVVRVLAAVSVVAGVWRVALGGELVQGLLLASPGMIVGGLCCTRARLRDPLLRVLVAVGVLSAGAVLATQYNRGAASEWGGRYLHVGLAPLLVVAAILLVEAWRTERRRQDGSDGWRWIVGAIVATSALFLIGMVQAQDVYRRAPAALRAEMLDAAGATPSANHPDGPVVVSTWLPWGRFAWDEIDQTRMFMTDGPDDLPRLAERIDADGTSSFVLVLRSDELDHADALRADWRIADSVEAEYGGHVLTLERRTS